MKEMLLVFQQCPEDRVLLLKPGCKVMLLWNKSESLRNGSQGRFISVKGNGVVVNFGGEGEILVKRERHGQKHPDQEIRLEAEPRSLSA